MTLSAMLDNALNGMDTDHKSTIKTILTTLHDDVVTARTTYGTKAQELAAWQSDVVALAQKLQGQMKPKA